jgi:hypothetical protein
LVTLVRAARKLLGAWREGRVTDYTGQLN